jgi:hypothetical protein
MRAATPLTNSDTHLTPILAPTANPHQHKENTVILKESSFRACHA